GEMAAEEEVVRRAVEGVPRDDDAAVGLDEHRVYAVRLWTERGRHYAAGAEGGIEVSGRGEPGARTPEGDSDDGHEQTTLHPHLPAAPRARLDRVPRGEAGRRRIPGQGTPVGRVPEECRQGVGRT